MDFFQKCSKNRRLGGLLYLCIFLAFCVLAMIEGRLYRRVEFIGYEQGVLQNLEVQDDGYLRITDPDANWIFPDVRLWMDSAEVDVEDVDGGGAARLSVRIYYDTGRGYNVNDSVLTMISGNDRDTWDRVMTIGKSGRIGSFRLQFGIDEDKAFKISRIVINPAERGWTIWMLAVILAGLFLAYLGSRGIGGRRQLPFMAVSAVLWLFFFLQASSVRQILLIQLLGILLVLAQLVLIFAFRMDEKRIGCDASAAAGEEKKYRAALLLLVFCTYLIWACHIPYMDGPDESMRYLVVDFIRTTGRLPRGDDPAVLNMVWGTSYAFNPILPYIAGGWLARIAGLFTESQTVFWTMAKLVNVINGTLLVYWCDRLSALLFPDSRARFLFPALAAFWPQMAYMAIYVNTDSLALMSSAMILYFWARGIQTGWTVPGCTGLGIGIGLCAMSYYNAYGYILLSIPLFYYSLWRAKKDKQVILKNTVIVSGLALAIGGWWFVRNAILYNGDFLARNASRECSEANALPEFKPSLKWTWRGSGRSPLDMLTESDYVEQTGKSFIGAFGQMNIMLHDSQYYFFAFVLNLGFVLFIAALIHFLRKRKKGDGQKQELTDRIFYYGILFAAAGIAGGLAFWYAYASDYQPQGRYWLPCFLPAAIFACTGYDRAEKWAYAGGERKGNTAACISVGLSLSVFFVFIAAVFGIAFTYYG